MLIREIEKRLPPGAKRSRVKRVEHLFSLFAPGESRPGLKRFNLLYAGPARKARSLDLDEVLDTLERGLVGTVAANCGENVFLKGGVVEYGGRAVVVLGGDGSGTTTLLKALLRAGGRYYSDRYAVIDRSGRAVPFPVPSEAAQQHGRTRSLKSIPIGCVLVTSFREGARFRPRRLSSAEAVMELLSSTPLLRYQPRRAMSRIRRVALRVPVLKSVRGEADEAAMSVLKSLHE